jgi:hypothetical protein
MKHSLNDPYDRDEEPGQGARPVENAFIRGAIAIAGTIIASAIIGIGAVLIFVGIVLLYRLF